MSQPVAVDGEFLVNTTTTDNQMWSSAAALTGGGFVVVWWDQSATGGDTSDGAIRGQRYDAAGNADGGEFLINTTTAGDQRRPSVTALEDGGFVAAWDDASASAVDVSGTAIRARRFDAVGNPQGADFVVNSTTADDQLFTQVAGLNGGGFVAVWRDDSAGVVNADIRLRIFDADGDPLGVDAVANTSTTGIQSFPSVSGLSDGGFVVSWTNQNPAGDGSGWSIQAQRYDATGNPDGGEFLVNTTTAANQGFSSVAALDGGGFVIVWQDLSASGDDPSGFAIRGQRYDAGGDPVGGEFLVNTTTASNQESADVAALPDGGFVVTWWDQSGATDAVRGQRYDAAGNPAGGEFLVSTTGGTAAEPDRVGLGVMSDGRVLVTWIEPAASGDGSGRSVWARLYTTSESSGSGSGSSGSGGEQGAITGSAGADYIIGSNAPDVIYGNLGDDVLLGLDGDDTLFGGQGQDQVFGDGGNDVLYGNLGADALHGGEGSDVVYGNQGDDIAYGNQGADTLYGGQGDDALYGGQGDDVLIGGAGDDWLAGNLGADSFVFGDGSGRDVIADFSAAEGDLLLVQANVNGTGIASAADLLARLGADADGNALLDLGGGNTVTLLGVPPSAAAADWFVVG